MLEILEEIIDKKVRFDLKYARTYVFKSGIFDPILQVIQGISFDDGLVINDIKVYTVGGLKYTLIPPGTEILVAYIGGDPGKPYLAGVDPNAAAVVSFTGMINGLINLVPASPGTPIISGSPVVIIKNPAIP